MTLRSTGRDHRAEPQPEVGERRTTHHLNDAQRSAAHEGGDERHALMYASELRRPMSALCRVTKAG